MHALLRKPALSIAALLLALPSVTAHAQSLAVFGSVETDDTDLNLFLVGASANPGRPRGWQPYASVIGYTIRGAGTSVAKNVVSPAVGLLNKYGGGQYQFGVGYAFADEDFEAPVFVPEGGSDGVTTSFQWNHWGRRRQASQFIASYNFGSEFLWTRLRQNFQLAEQSPLWVGGEAGILGGGQGTKSWIAQFGPTVEWRFNPQFRLGASAGLKKGISDVNKSFDPWYLRAEFLFLPFQKE